MTLLAAHIQRRPVAPPAAAPCLLCDQVIEGEAACSDCIAVLAFELRHRTRA